MVRGCLAAGFVLVLLGSSVAAIGRGGLVLAVYLLVFLVAVWLWRVGTRGVRSVARVATIVMLFPLVMLALSPFMGSAREAGRRTQCGNNLHQIALALLAYEERNGCLPPACVCDKEGKPMHSWRVLILPYLRENSLYEEYSFNEPWNGPSNRLLESRMPPCYVCPSAREAGANEPPMTSYVVVTGPDTAFPGCRSRQLKEITDRREDTVLLVEVPHSDIRWMEPRDPSLDDLVASRGGENPVVGSHHLRYADAWHYAQPVAGNVARADASVWYLCAPLGGDDAKAVLSVAGGERLTLEELSDRKRVPAGLRWDQIIGRPLFWVSLVALVVLAVTARRKEGGHSCPPQTDT